MRASGGWVADKTARHCAARTSLQSEHAGWNPTRVGFGILRAQHGFGDFKGPTYLAPQERLTHTCTVSPKTEVEGHHSLPRSTVMDWKDGERGWFLLLKEACLGCGLNCRAQAFQRAPTRGLDALRLWICPPFAVWDMFRAQHSFQSPFFCTEILKCNTIL